MWLCAHPHTYTSVWPYSSLPHLHISVTCLPPTHLHTNMSPLAPHTPTHSCGHTHTLDTYTLVWLSSHLVWLSSHPHTYTAVQPCLHPTHLHTSLGKRGLLQTSEHTYFTGSHPPPSTPILVSVHDKRWLLTFRCSHPLPWALESIFFLVACKDSKFAPCSVSRETAYISSFVGDRAACAGHPRGEG